MRSETSLVQTVGRAARNVEGRVIMYADQITDSMRRAIDETNRRRKIQMDFNEKHGIQPQTIQKAVHDVLEITKPLEEKQEMSLLQMEAAFAQLEEQMLQAAAALDFEQAAKLRDQLFKLREKRDGKVTDVPKGTRRMTAKNPRRRRRS